MGLILRHLKAARSLFLFIRKNNHLNDLRSLTNTLAPTISLISPAIHVPLRCFLRRSLCRGWIWDFSIIALSRTGHGIHVSVNVITDCHYQMCNCVQDAISWSRLWSCCGRQRLACVRECMEALRSEVLTVSWARAVHPRVVLENKTTSP